MDIAFLLILLGVVFMVASIGNRNMENKIHEAMRKKPCPPHKWQWVKQPGADFEYLQCSRCGVLPGRTDGEEL